MSITSINIDTIEPPLAYIFSGVFFVIGVTSSIGNTLALIAMYRSKITSRSTRRVSTWFLYSLASACAIEGYVWSTVCGIHLLTVELRENIYIEYIRRYLGVWFQGTAIVSLACISYDRYILLKYKTNHNKYMSRRTSIGLLVFGWLCPFLLPLLRHVDEKVFYLSVLLLISLSFVCLSFAYYFILRIVFVSERNIKKNSKRSFQLSPTDPGNIDATIACSNVTLKKTSTQYEKVSSFRTTFRTIELTKTVSLLLLSYLVCHITLTFLFVLKLTKPNFESKYNRQIILLVAEASAQLNASLNAIIYFMKSQTYRKAIANICCSKRNVYAN